jgi:hypothetical protein
VNDLRTAWGSDWSTECLPHVNTALRLLLPVHNVGRAHTSMDDSETSALYKGTVQHLRLLQTSLTGSSDIRSRAITQRNPRSMPLKRAPPDPLPHNTRRAKKHRHPTLVREQDRSSCMVSPRRSPAHCLRVHIVPSRTPARLEPHPHPR